jgi:hypothetical protein
MYNMQAIVSTNIGKGKKRGGGMKTVGAIKMYKQIYRLLNKKKITFVMEFPMGKMGLYQLMHV